VSAIVEQHEVPIGDVVEDRDRDLKGHHPIVAPRGPGEPALAAGPVRRAHAGLCRDTHLHLGDAVDQV
jgi:hypothetical protein